MKAKKTSSEVIQNLQNRGIKYSLWPGFREKGEKDQYLSENKR